MSPAPNAGKRLSSGRNLKMQSKLTSQRHQSASWYGRIGTVLCSLHTAIIMNGAQNVMRHGVNASVEKMYCLDDAGGPADPTLLTAGQTAGGIKHIPKVAEIMRRLVAETSASTRVADLLEAAQQGPEGLPTHRRQCETAAPRADCWLSTIRDARTLQSHPCIAMPTSATLPNAAIKHRSATWEPPVGGGA